MLTLKLQHLPGDIWRHIVPYLGNKEISKLSAASNPKFAYTLVKALFQSQNNIASKTKGKFLVQLQKQKGTIPFLYPPKNLLCKALAGLKLKEQLLGLNLISSDLVKEKTVVSESEFSQFSNKIKTNSFSPQRDLLFNIDGNVSSKTDLSFLFLLDEKQRNAILKNIILSFKNLPPSHIATAIEGYLIFADFFTKAELDEIVSLLLNLFENEGKTIRLKAYDTLMKLAPMLYQSQINNILNFILATTQQGKLEKGDILNALIKIIPFCKKNQNKLILEFMLPFLDFFEQSIFPSIGHVFDELILVLDEEQRAQTLSYILPFLNSLDPNIASQALVIFLKLANHFNRKQIKEQISTIQSLLKAFTDKSESISDILQAIGQFNLVEREEKRQLTELVQPYLNHLNPTIRLTALFVFMKLTGLADKVKLENFFNDIIQPNQDETLNANAYLLINGFANFLNSTQKNNALEIILSFIRNLDETYYPIILMLFLELIKTFNPDEKNQALERIFLILEKQDIIHTLHILNSIDTVNKELATKLFKVLKLGSASENPDICFLILTAFYELAPNLNKTELHENIKPLLMNNNAANKYAAILLLEKIGEYDAYFDNLIKIIKSTDCSESLRKLALEQYVTSLISYVSNEENEFKQIALNALQKIRPTISNKIKYFFDIPQALMDGQSFYFTEQYEILEGVKIQIQRAEWAIQLEQLKIQFEAGSLLDERLKAFLLNPLLQPLSTNQGFAPASELQKNTIKIVCNPLSSPLLMNLSYSILNLSLHQKTLIAQGTVGETIIAYTLAFGFPINHTHLSETYRLHLKPLIEKIKSIHFRVSEEEKNFYWALTELNQQTEEAKHSLTKETIQHLINQVKTYKEENIVAINELTDILNDTTNLLIGKISIEAYRAKADTLYGKRSSAKQILGISLMMIALIFSIVSIASLAILPGLAAIILSTISIMLISSGLAFLFKGLEQKGLAKVTNQLADDLETNSLSTNN